MRPDWTPQQSDEFARRRRARNIALGLFLGCLAILFFGITVVRMIK